MKNIDNLADNDSINENDDLELILSRSKKLRPQHVDEGRHVFTIIAVEHEKNRGEPDKLWVYLEDECGDKMWHKFVLQATGRRALGMFCHLLELFCHDEGRIPAAWMLTGKVFCAEVRVAANGDNHLVNWRPVKPGVAK
jgi:hypothetical protein